MGRDDRSLPALRVFSDTNVIFSAIYGRYRDPGARNPAGASLTLCELGRARMVDLVVSDLVLEEARSVLRRKLPEAVPHLEGFIALSTKLVEAPDSDSVRRALGCVSDPADAPVLACAANCGCRFLVTLNPRHFPDRYGTMEVVTPGELIARVRRHLTGLEPLDLPDHRP
ncbi:MAG: PIN domain-containing protein [Anaerolineae bacterium]|nr:PIN domain-containing protein [Anaerolineae bacterium]